MSVAYAMATGGGLSGVRGRLEALGKVPLKLASRRHVVRKISSRAMMARLRSVESPWQVVDRHRRLCVAEPDEEGELKVTT